ncbi:BglG family transcription antiterminator LicT [Lactococcus sp. DD01]|uniref:BglG family transcription antiterminator LicT n=1 Tax=Lactococcus sp. DD01 TaxID=1776443 RepID=UPI00077683F0|nr:PRD domain-containing protein [Lactococcus sp. DD01]KXT60768.1 Beta-glucoside bgl operon antiterminator, BglG family [Lactococcus sp. DD01]
MQIRKILNNNVVIAINSRNEEIILMGLGIGFKKRIGQAVEVDKIEKIFGLKASSDIQSFSEILNEIPSAIIELSMVTLSEVKVKFDKEVSDTTLVAFADHLHAALLRTEENIAVKNFLRWDIKRFFPEEFKICLKALEKVKEQFGVELPEDEAGFLTMHIVNGTLGTGHEYAMQLTKLMEEILTTLKYTLKITFDEQDIYFQRFITHLKFFTERILAGSTRVEETDKELFALIVRKYPNAYLGTRKVSEFLNQTRDYEVSESEQIYMTVHLARILEKIQ